MMQMKLLAFLVALLLTPPVLQAADSNLPYTGKVADKTLSATDKARSVLLSKKSEMQSWTKGDWQDWADERFSAETSPDGSSWRDWQKARIKSASDNAVLPLLENLNKPALDWSASDWNLFVNNVDTDYRSSDRYFCVILPSGQGQHRGQFLLGRWAYAMYNNALSEKQSWEEANSEEEGQNSDESQIALLLQANAEMTAILSGIICALIIAVTWRW